MKIREREKYKKINEKREERGRDVKLLDAYPDAGVEGKGWNKALGGGGRLITLFISSVGAILVFKSCSSLPRKNSKSANVRSRLSSTNTNCDNIIKI